MSTMSGKLKLFCWVKGNDDMNDVFPIDIEKSETVADLRKAIANEDRFNGIDPSRVKLWNVSIPHDDGFMEHVKYTARGGPLIVTKLLSNIFRNGAEPEHVHIIVDASSGAGKAPQQPPVDDITVNVLNSPTHIKADPIDEASPIYTFIDISIAGENSGRIIFRLYNHKAPKTIETFRALCRDGKGEAVSSTQLCYKGSEILGIIPGSMVQFGEFEAADGTGTQLLYEQNFKDEATSSASSLDRPFLLIMARDPLQYGDGNALQIIITVSKDLQLSGPFVLLGEVIKGKSTVRKIEHCKISLDFPIDPVIIEECGELSPEILALHDSRNVSVEDDGDPYEDWPVDEEGFNFREPEIALTISQHLRQIGAKAHREKDFKRAVEKSIKALRYLDIHAEPFPGSDPILEKLQSQRIPLLLNASLALLNTEPPDPEEAVGCTNRVLKVNNLPTVDKAKALYRRGLAEVLLKRDDEAEKDFEEADKLLEGKDAAVKAQLIRVKEQPKDIPNSSEPGTRAPPSGASSSEPAGSFNLRVAKEFWPEFRPGYETMEGTGPLHFDFTETIHKRWGRGADVGREFGPSIFLANEVRSNLLPNRLVDLVEDRVVLTSEIGFVRYTILSHVWGNVTQVDGNRYGVDWKIPVSSRSKLDQMLTAARIIGGERYAWIDILCLDQRRRNESEIARMGMYYTNARGCIVYLDKADNDQEWAEALSTIVEMNDRYGLDKAGIPTRSVTDMMQDGVFTWNIKETEGIAWIEKMIALEKAPWFRRVWTLQEGVIPENLHFITPERYMFGSACMFQLVGLCGMVANIMLDTGAMGGLAMTSMLQQSEIWKMLRLRQLYRKGRVHYWHVVQATKTRSSKLQQDKVLGICGLLHGRSPTIDYSRTLEELYRDVYLSSIEQNDFGAACFFGGTPQMPASDSHPFIISGSPSQRETHRLSIASNGLRLDDVGIDYITQVWPFVGDGKLQEWKSQFPPFLNLSIDAHIDVAKAFELPTDTIDGSQVCPAAFAAISALTAGDSSVLAALGDQFSEMYYKAVPKGTLMWTKAVTLMQASKDIAFAVIWTTSADPQLAVVTEPIEGTVAIVTPSSYVEHPGEGCMICKVNSNGTFQRIGFGLGTGVKVEKMGSLVIV